MLHVFRSVFVLLICGAVLWAVSPQGVLKPIGKLAFLDNSQVLAIAAATAVVAALLSSIADVTGLFALLRAYKNERELSKAKGIGPFTTEDLRHSTRSYIEPLCSNIDPMREMDLRQAAIAIQGNLFQHLDIFLDNETKSKHLFVLADSGMGKTAFVLNYFLHNSKRRSRFWKKRGYPLLLVPLGRDNSDAWITSVPRAKRSQTVLILDALDEDVLASRDYAPRVAQLMNMAQDYRRIVVTCRTQFFSRDEEIPRETGIVRISPRGDESRTYQFTKMHIAPFSTEQVEQFMKSRYPIWRWSARKRARTTVSHVQDLAARPMLLKMICSLDREVRQIESSRDLYQELVDQWIRRESGWIAGEVLKRFSNEIAISLYTKRVERKMEMIPYEEIQTIASDIGVSTPARLLSARSLLNRDGEGNFKFAHRSIHEYLFIEAMLDGDIRCLGQELSDQMVKFLSEYLQTQRVSLSTIRRFVVWSFDKEPGESLIDHNEIRHSKRSSNFLTHARMIKAFEDWLKNSPANITSRIAPVIRAFTASYSPSVLHGKGDPYKTQKLPINDLSAHLVYLFDRLAHASSNDLRAREQSCIFIEYAIRLTKDCDIFREYHSRCGGVLITHDGTLAIGYFYPRHASLP